MLTNVTPYICETQADVFELSGKRGYDSADFMRKYMNSEVAFFADGIYSRYQWMHDAYVLNEVERELRKSGGIKKGGEILPGEFLWWTGYFYRYWHELTGELSKDIYAKADIELMIGIYPGYHTLPIEKAVPRLLAGLAEREALRQRGVDFVLPERIPSC